MKMSKQSSIKAFLDFWRLYLIINKSFNFFVIFTTFHNLGCYTFIYEYATGNMS